MKKLFRICVFLFVLSLLPCLFAQELPRPAGFINDFAGVMSAEDFKKADELAAIVKEKTGAELAIVTVKTFAPYATIEDFSEALFKSWGIGEKGKDNGILLALSVSERKVRIEVGYGLEGAIPDSAAGRILDNNVIPYFRNDDFSGGLLNGYKAIAARIAKEYNVDLSGYDLPEEKESKQSGLEIILTILFILVIGLFVPLFLRRKFSGGRSGGNFPDSDSGGSSGGGDFGGGSSGGGGASRDF
jgi:uncharacterized protein